MKGLFINKFMYTLTMCTAHEQVTQYISEELTPFPKLCDSEFLQGAEDCVPTSSAVLQHAWRSPRCACMLINFPSALKTVQISKNINSTNVSKLSAWCSLSYSRGKLGILQACESYCGQKSLKNLRGTCLGRRRLLPVQDCCLVLGWVKFLNLSCCFHLICWHRFIFLLHMWCSVLS